MDSASLHCPDCGAAVSSDATQCKYCNSLLQTVACPSCFGLMFVGSKFCPHCGAAAVVVAPGPDVPHPCPRCETETMKVVSLSGVQLEECPHCGGLWIGVEVFDRICSQKEAAEAAIAVPLPPPVPVEYHVRYLKCPQCAKLMNRYKFADRCGVVLDKCSLHGIWFDRDELRQIIEFIRAGGLDLARVREIETLNRQQRAKELDQRLANVGTGGQGAYSLGDFQNSHDSASVLGVLASFINAFLD
jgi:Zn-finger nucleic acid-binding protein